MCYFIVILLFIAIVFGVILADKKLHKKQDKKKQQIRYRHSK